MSRAPRGEPEVPSGLLATLVRAPDAPMVLLIRHADRPPLPPGGGGKKVPITEFGARRAAKLGELLEGRLARAASSTARRCQQTAEVVMQAAGLPPVVREHDVLGMTGPFVADLGRAMRLTDQLGMGTVVRALVAGQELAGMRGLHQGAEILLALVKMRLGISLDPTRQAEPGVTLMVSHDAIIMPTIAAFTGDRFVGSWLDPLDGVAFWRDGDTVICGWQGRIYEIAAAGASSPNPAR